MSTRIPSWLLRWATRAIRWSFIFGGLSVGNLLSLININEQVDYAAMFAPGDGRPRPLVGFAGPGLANGTMYLVSLFLLRWPGVRRNVMLFMLVFWFNFMNVANFV